MFVLQSGHHSSVQEEGEQWEFSSTERCGPIQLAGRLEGLQVMPSSSSSSSSFLCFRNAESVISNKPQGAPGRTEALHRQTTGDQGAIPEEHQDSRAIDGWTDRNKDEH